MQRLALSPKSKRPIRSWKLMDTNKKICLINQGFKVTSKNSRLTTLRVNKLMENNHIFQELKIKNLTTPKELILTKLFTMWWKIVIKFKSVLKIWINSTTSLRPQLSLQTCRSVIPYQNFRNMLKRVIKSKIGMKKTYIKLILIKRNTQKNQKSLNPKMLALFKKRMKTNTTSPFKSKVHFGEMGQYLVKRLTCCSCLQRKMIKI